ncbi:unnamed protein product [Blepharisma stoltei]|uniref:Uncharacterized protein n=1 Tax=Blepharisma stoltei TaxID=1481888 RepID=A0AAU9IA32_9CILI|nr:unnamed protein product [Blepharisma stoltei]
MNDFHIYDKLNHSSQFLYSPTAHHPRSNVFDRLMSDSAVRKTNSDVLLYTQQIRPKAKPQKLEYKIEEILMRKHHESQARLTALKLKYQAEELKDLRPVPQINSVSRKIVEISAKLASDEEQKSFRENGLARIQEVLSSSRFSKKNLNIDSEPKTLNSLPEAPSTSKSVPKQTEISLKELEKAINSNEASPKQAFSPKIFQFPTGNTSPKSLAKSQHSYNLSSPARATTVPTSRGSIDTQKPLKKPHEVSALSLEELRQAVKARPKVFEHEEPPDLLDMDVLERGKFWMKYKKEKIELEKKRQDDREIEGCTFTPQISPRVNYSETSFSGLNRSASPAQLNLSYTQIYLNKKHYRSVSNNWRPSSALGRATKEVKKITPKIKQLKAKSPPRALRNISPTVKNISYQSGFNVDQLISRAQPMVDYRALGAI